MLEDGVPIRAEVAGL